MARKLSKKMIINALKKKLKSKGIDVDLIDLDALVDASLNYKENEKIVFDYIKKHADEIAREKYDKEYIDYLKKVAEDYFMSLPEKAQEIDVRYKAKKTIDLEKSLNPEKDLEKWMENTSKYDVLGVDAVEGESKRKQQRLSKEELIERINKLEEKRAKEGKLSKEERSLVSYYKRTLKKRYGVDWNAEYGDKYEKKKKTHKDKKEEVEHKAKSEVLDKNEVVEVDMENMDFADWVDVLDFGNKNIRVAIFGLQGSGKTTLAKDIASEYKKNTFVYDMIGEFDGYNRYLAKHRQYPDTKVEFDRFYKWYKNKVLDKKIKNILIIDEANRIAPNGRTMAEGLAELNDLHRHYNNSLVVVARRPAQLNTDLTELAHYIVSFRLAGENDIKKLNSIKKGLGDLVRTLKGHEFVIYDVVNDKIYKSKLNI